MGDSVPSFVSAYWGKLTTIEFGPEWWIVFLTAGLFLVGAAQLLVFWAQARALRQTVALSKDTSVRQLRAYILISDTKVYGFQSDQEICYATITMKNSGQTPAYGVDSWAGIGVFKYPVQIDLPPPSPGAGSQMNLGPQDKSAMLPKLSKPLTHDQRRAILAGESAILVWGEIKYFDIFNIKHVYNFQLIFGGPAGVTSDGTMFAMDATGTPD